MTKDTKRSIMIAGRKTSVSLEDEFFDYLRDTARANGVTFSDLVAHVREKAPGINVSSSLRVFAIGLALGKIKPPARWKS